MERHHNAGHKNTRVICWLISLLVLVASPGLAQAAISCGACHGGDATTGVRDTTGAAPGTRAVGTPGTPGTGGTFIGNHVTHLPAVQNAGQCVACHGAAAAAYTSSHSAINNSRIQMASKIDNYSGAKRPRYGKGLFWNMTSVPVLTDPVATCNNVNCHFERKTDIWGITPAYTTTAANRTACAKCHDYAPRTKAHTAHFKFYSTAAGLLNTCNKCHVDYTAAGTDRMKFQHATSAGRRIAVLPTVGYVGGNNLYLPPNNPAQTFGTCSTLACHSNGITGTPVSWDTNINVSTGCNFCHPNLTGAHGKHTGAIVNKIYANYTANSSSGADAGVAAYRFGCLNCHPVSSASHIDGTIQVEVSKTATPLIAGTLRYLNAPTATYIGGSKTCANVYCHGSGIGTPAKTTIGWALTFTGDRCAHCHDNSPSTGAHQSHKIGIHSDNIFNGTSGFLKYSSVGSVAHGIATQATTISCNICHASTVATGYNKASNSCSTVACHGGDLAARVALLDAPDGFKFHVNGKVDVSLKPIKIVSKAQIRDSSFTSYSGLWTRTTYKQGAGSFDTAKTALSNTMWTAGAPGLGSCANISCHNLRVGQSVTWNQTLQCVDCHSQL